MVRDVTHFLTVSESPMIVNERFGRVIATVEPALISCSHERVYWDIETSPLTYHLDVASHPKTLPRGRSYFSQEKE